MPNRCITLVQILFKEVLVVPYALQLHFLVKPLLLWRLLDSDHLDFGPFWEVVRRHHQIFVSIRWNRERPKNIDRNSLPRTSWEVLLQFLLTLLIWMYMEQHKLHRLSFRHFPFSNWLIISNTRASQLVQIWFSPIGRICVSSLPWVVTFCNILF